MQPAVMMSSACYSSEAHASIHDLHRSPCAKSICSQAPWSHRAGLMQSPNSQEWRCAEPITFSMAHALSQSSRRRSMDQMTALMKMDTCFLRSWHGSLMPNAQLRMKDEARGRSQFGEQERPAANSYSLMISLTSACC